MLTVETEDKEYGEIYPAWTVCRDRLLQVSSDNVLSDKVNRTITNDAENVVIPIAGTSEINSQMHLSMRKTLKDGTMEFLKDDTDMEALMTDRDEHWLLKTPEQRRDFLIPFLNTRLMITEAVSLSTKNVNGIVKLEESRSDVKDSYMSLTMLNYFFEKLTNKYAQDENQNEDFNLDEWNFLSGVY
jgi:hypothetical protein